MERRLVIAGALALVTCHCGGAANGDATSSGGASSSSSANAGGAGTGGSSATSGGSSAGGHGGGPVDDGPLPIDLPSQGALKGSKHKVFAHYFTPYPISIDNKDASVDYYTPGYLAPDGENGKHVAYGGLLRQRPLPRPVDPSAAWELDDMKTEVTRASGAGLDGFTVDMLSLSGYNWTRLDTLLQAAKAVDPKFSIVLMPDGTAGDVADPDALATAVAGLETTYGSTLYHLDDGRLVISPFDPETQGAAWWQSWLGTMKSAHGLDVAFVPCFLNYGANADAFAPFSYGFSNWGNRSPATNMSLAGGISDAHARGKIWMQAVSVQDERPDSSVYDEADNSENLRITWEAAIGGADWVQIPTWNDYSEGAEVAPSTGTGWSPLDISSYYLVQFKTGTAPKIVRDVIYVSHRIQLAGATVTNETKPMVPRAGTAPNRDDVEVLSFLTKPATIELTIGGSTKSYAAPAGMSAKLYPIAAGSISAKVVRSGNTVTKITSPYAVTTGDVMIQDLGYRFVSSGRGN